MPEEGEEQEEYADEELRMEKIIPLFYARRYVLQFHDHAGNTLREDEDQDGVQEHVITQAIREGAMKEHRGDGNDTEIRMCPVQQQEEFSRKRFHLDKVDAERFQTGPQIAFHEKEFEHGPSIKRRKRKHSDASEEFPEFIRDRTTRDSRRPADRIDVPETENRRDRDDDREQEEWQFFPGYWVHASIITECSGIRLRCFLFLCLKHRLYPDALDLPFLFRSHKLLSFRIELFIDIASLRYHLLQQDTKVYF